MSMRCLSLFYQLFLLTHVKGSNQMRKFRNSALAIATATTVAFGGVSVASAEAPVVEDDVVLSDSLSSPSLSSNLNEWLELDKGAEADGRAIFGSDKTGFGEQPRWAQLFYGIGVTTAIASFIGLIAGPIYNFFTYNNFGL